MEAVTIIEGILAAVLVLLLTWGTTWLKRALLRYGDQIQTPQRDQARSGCVSKPWDSPTAKKHATGMFLPPLRRDRPF